MVALSSGDIAAAGDHGGDHVHLSIFDTDGNETFNDRIVSGTNPVIAELSNGSIVVAASDASGVYYSVVDQFGNIDPSFDDVSALVGSGISNLSVAALQSGDFAVACQRDDGLGNYQILIDIRDADTGSQIGLAVAATGTDEVRNPSIAVLDNGNFVVTWEVDDSGDTAVMMAIFDEAGTPILTPTVVDDSSGNFNGKPVVAALHDNGTSSGFLVAYQQNDSGDDAVVLKRFDAAGSETDQATFEELGEDYREPSLAVLPSGNIILGSTYDYGSDTDPYYRIIDASTLNELAWRWDGDGDDEGQTALAAVANHTVAAFYTSIGDDEVVGDLLVETRWSDSDSAGDLITGDGMIDDMWGNGGNDTLVGGSGPYEDVANYIGAWSEYLITSSGGVLTIKDNVANRDGTDTVSGVERFYFDWDGWEYSASEVVDVAPIGVNDANTGDLVMEDIDATATGNVLFNDTDVNDYLGDTTAVNGVRTGTEAAGGSLGAIGGAGVKGTYGTLVIAADGTFTYTLDNADADTQALKTGQAVTDVFTYRVVDSKGLVDTAQLTINVTGMNDAPVITSNGGGASAAVSIVENTTLVTTVAATDADSSPILYALVGTDAGKFKLVGNQLHFASPADFDNRTDANSDGIYDVTVVALDGTAADTQALSVSLTNVLGNTVTGTKKGDKIDLTNKVKGLGATGEEDTIDGKKGNDVIKAGDANDKLIGGEGKDTLTGDAGSDAFVFNAKLGSSNVDTITDFVHDTDVIHLDDNIFKKIGIALDAPEFYAKKGADEAHDKDDRIIYDKKSGKLYYDADGNKAGGVDAVHFATLSPKLALDAGDFAIV